MSDAEREKELRERLDNLWQALPDHQREEFVELVRELVGSPTTIWSRFTTVRRWLGRH